MAAGLASAVLGAAAAGADASAGGALAGGEASAGGAAAGGASAGGADAGALAAAAEAVEAGAGPVAAAGASGGPLPAPGDGGGPVGFDSAVMVAACVGTSGASYAAVEPGAGETSWLAVTTSAIFAAALPALLDADEVAPPALALSLAGGGLAGVEDEEFCSPPVDDGVEELLLAVSVGGGVPLEALLLLLPLAGVDAAGALPDAVEAEATADVAAVELGTSGAEVAAVDAAAGFADAAPVEPLAAADCALLEALPSSALPATTRLRGRK